MESVVLDALVLHATDQGEAHRIVELSTRARGLVRALAPGARRSRRRFGGALEPFTHLRATVRFRGGRDLATLEEVSVIAAHPRIRDDLGLIGRAGFLVDLARSLARDLQPHPELHDLLLSGLGRLDAGTFPRWGLVAFEVAALDAFGAAPQLGACARCGRTPSGESSRFAPTAGGLLCPVCEPGWLPGDVTVTRRALRALQSLAAAGPDPEVLERASHLPEDSEALAEAWAALRRFTEHLLGRRLKSLGFLEQVL